MEKDMTTRKTTSTRTTKKAETKPADPTDGGGEDSTGTATAEKDSKKTGDADSETKEATGDADAAEAGDSDQADDGADGKDTAVPRHTVQKRDDGRAVVTLVDSGDTVTMVKLLLSVTDDVATVTSPQGFVVPQSVVDELGLG